MAEWTITVNKQIPLPGGYKLLEGSAVGGSSYSTGGDVFNLSPYFELASSPSVSATCSGGYVVHFIGDATSSGTMTIHSAGSEVSGSTDVSWCTIQFCAVGNGK